MSEGDCDVIGMTVHGDEACFLPSGHGVKHGWDLQARELYKQIVMLRWERDEAQAANAALLPVVAAAREAMTSHKGCSLLIANGRYSDAYGNAAIPCPLCRALHKLDGGEG